MPRVSEADTATWWNGEKFESSEAGSPSGRSKAESRVRVSRMDESEVTQGSRAQFEYVDFAAREMPGFRNRVILADQAMKLASQYGKKGCYTTCLLFGQELAEHVRKTGTVSGYEGMGHVHYLPVDVDHEDIGMARGAALALARCLKAGLGIQDEAVLVYFSGMKGFHVMVDARAFGGLEPSRDLHLVLDAVRRSLARLAKLGPECIDFSIRDKLRLWRLPNTQHEVSGLFKVRLTGQELLKPDLELWIMDQRREVWREGPQGE